MCVSEGAAHRLRGKWRTLAEAWASRFAAGPSALVPPMANRRRDRSWMRLSGLGVEFFAAVAGFTLVGVWIDRHYDTAPWGVLIGALLGIFGAMYNLIRESVRASRRSDSDNESKRP